MEELDHNVGRILDHLKELNIDDNTIVIFTSDNGPWLSKGKDGGSALPLFEGKFTHFEGGQRVPAIVRWPARIPAGGVCTELASSMDLLPTLAKIVDAPLANKMSVDGKDIIDLLTQKPGVTSPHEYFFFGQHAVRRGEWKYHKAFKFKTKKPTKTEKAPALYNLKNDIGESTNVIDQYPEIAAQLQKALNTMNPNVNQKK
jgi:arylsulfatase A-like enzyme